MLEGHVSWWTVGTAECTRGGGGGGGGDIYAIDGSWNAHNIGSVWHKRVRSDQVRSAANGRQQQDGIR